MTGFDRRSFISTIAAAAVAAPLVGHQAAAQPGSVGLDDSFTFWRRNDNSTPEWTSVIADAWLDLTARSGRYTATLEFTPTQEEKNALMYELNPAEVTSHVDVVFTIEGLVPLGPRAVFAPGGGDHIRFAGSEVSHDGANTVFTVRCFNIEKRWDANVPILVTAALSGYGQSQNEVAPQVTVQLLPCAYSVSYEPVDGVIYSRETDEITKYYRRWDTGEPVTLYGSSGRGQFGFREI